MARKRAERVTRLSVTAQGTGLRKVREVARFLTAAEKSWYHTLITFIAGNGVR